MKVRGHEISESVQEHVFRSICVKKSFTRWELARGLEGLGIPDYDSNGNEVSVVAASRLMLKWRRGIKIKQIKGGWTADFEGESGNIAETERLKAKRKRKRIIAENRKLLSGLQGGPMMQAIYPSDEPNEFELRVDIRNMDKDQAMALAQLVETWLDDNCPAWADNGLGRFVR